MHRAICSLLLVLGWSAVGWADVIIFANGDRLTGKLAKLENSKLIFNADEIGEITVDITRIRNIGADEPADLHFSDGTVIKSSVQISEPGRMAVAQTALLPAQDFSLADLVAINPPAKPEPKWSGSVTIGLSSTHGNTFAENANLSFDAKRRSEKDRIHAYSTYLASRSRDPDTYEKYTTQESFLVGGKYDYFFTKKFYCYADGRFSKDHIADLDHRIIAGLGAGYQWVETDTLSFDTEAGLADVCEQYTRRDPVSGMKVTTKSEEASMQLGYHLDWKLAEKVTFLHKLTYYPSFSSPSDYFLTTGAELRAAITDSMFSSFKAVLDYDSIPAQGVGTSDTKYILGVGWNF